MIGIRNKEIFKSDRITKLIEEVNKPMSLNEIMYKFNVSYPFKVKCVVEFYYLKDYRSANMLGKIFTYYTDFALDNTKAIAYETTDGQEGKDSKKFQYIP